jgi:multidrug efflux system outer membrane protein
MVTFTSSRAGRTMRQLQRAAVLLSGWLLVACASWWPRATPLLPAIVSVPLAAQWQAPLPHGGELGELARWWRQFDDPLLADLIEAGQRVSPSLAQARSRIEQARASLISAGAALAPGADASASAARGRFDLSSPSGSSLSAALQARWELDLFGAAGAGRDAAQARLEGAQASWHEARVSLAAEIGLAYLNLRACEAQLAQARLDAGSRAQTARLTELSAKAGFQAPASAALARASAAQGQASVAQIQAQCAAQIKSLVALTALDEPALRQQLVPATARLPEPAQIAVRQVPAQALAQRPDIHAAAREVSAASFDATQAQARRYPSVALAGSIGPARFDAGSFSTSGTVWSLGPLSVTLPLFDGGARAASAQAARARYDAAVTGYGASLRNAVREVEDALLALQSTAARGLDARNAAEGFAQSYLASQARYANGLTSLFELEDARRSLVAAQSALLDLQRERVAAWIALYRALGGGWTAEPAAAPVANNINETTRKTTTP